VPPDGPAGGDKIEATELDRETLEGAMDAAIAKLDVLIVK
jgi:hypothetical protein